MPGREEGDRSVNEIPTDSEKLSYRDLLWEVLGASAELEEVRQGLKVVQGVVTGVTEATDLGIIHDRLAEVCTVFGQVRGRAQAAACYAQAHERELQLSALSEQNVSAALGMLPGVAAQLGLLAEVVARISDAAVPVPADER
jgi:hypothetical protein